MTGAGSLPANYDPIVKTGDGDPSVAAARRDVATVTASGRPLAQCIEGVISAAPVNHVDHRGRVFEIYGGESSHWAEPIVYCYAFSVRPGLVKGWGLHEHKDDRYTLICGELLVILYDARVDTPTYGLVQKVMLTPEGTRQVLIPAGVWHLNICMSPNEAFVVNHPTRIYDHASPDRLVLPFDTDEIPVDIPALFPTQFTS